MSTIANNLKEFRAKGVNKVLLCKADGRGQIEIKNKRNNQMNYFNVGEENKPVRLRGQEFVNFSFDLKCYECIERGKNKYPTLLGRAFGTDLKVEIKCRKCGAINYFDVSKIVAKKLHPMSMDNRKRYIARLTTALN